MGRLCTHKAEGRKIPAGKENNSVEIHARTLKPLTSNVHNTDYLVRLEI